MCAKNLVSGDETIGETTVTFGEAIKPGTERNGTGSN